MMASLLDFADLCDLCPAALPHRENARLILFNVPRQKSRMLLYVYASLTSR